MRLLTAFFILMTMPLLCSGQYNQQRKSRFPTRDQTMKLHNFAIHFSTIPAKTTAVHPAFSNKTEWEENNRLYPSVMRNPSVHPYKPYLPDKALIQKRNLFTGNPALQGGTFEPFIQTAFSLITGKPY